MGLESFQPCPSLPFNYGGGDGGWGEERTTHGGHGQALSEVSRSGPPGNTLPVFAGARPSSSQPCTHPRFHSPHTQEPQCYRPVTSHPLSPDPQPACTPVPSLCLLPFGVTAYAGKEEEEDVHHPPRQASSRTCARTTPPALGPLAAAGAEPVSSLDVRRQPASRQSPAESG